jgi:hypothetical protein
MKSLFFFGIIALFFISFTFASAPSSNPFHEIEKNEIIKNTNAQISSALKQISSSIESFHTNTRALTAKLQTAHKHMISQSASSGVRTQASATCTTAIDTLITKSSDCSKTTESLLSFSTTSTTTSAVTSFCTSTCYTDLTAAFNAYTSACASIEASADPFTSTTSITVGTSTMTKSELLTSTLTMFKTACVQSGTEYCLPKFVSSFASMSTTSSTAVTVSALTSICTDCTVKLFEVMVDVGFGSDSDFNSAKALTATFAMMCSTDVTEVSSSNPKGFCAVSFVAATSSIDTTKMMTTMCSTCGRKMISLAAAVAATATSGSTSGSSLTSTMSSMMSQICIKHPDGTLCMSKFMDLSSSASASTDPCGMLASIGCCINAYFDIAANMAVAALGENASASLIASARSSMDTTKASASKTAKEACGSELPAACSSTTVIQSTVKINNFKYSYYVANQVTVKAALKKDIARIASVFEDKITIKTVAEASATTTTNTGTASFINKLFKTLATSTSGITVTYTVALSNDSEAAPTKAALVAAAAADKSQFTSVGSIGAASKVDSSQARTHTYT